MSVRAKFHLLIFAGWLGGGSVVALVTQAHPPWAVLLWLLAVIVAAVALGMRCPNCRRRLAWQGYLMFPVLPRRCRYCGHDLGRRTPKTGSGN